MPKDCRDCKHSYYEGDNLICGLNDEVLYAMLPKNHKGIPSMWELKYPKVCNDYDTGIKRGRKPWCEIKDFDYGTIKGKYSKYERGEVISDIKVLLEQKVIIWNDTTKNIEVLKSLPLRVILSCLKDKCFYYAVPKKKEKQI